MAEDVVEYWAETLKDSLKDRVAQFFEERATGHHPEVVDALCGLIDSGRLAELLD